MKTILIDELIKSSKTEESFKLQIEGKFYTTYHIAKSLNYNKSNISMKERIKMVIDIIKGNAIAVTYFSDLLKEEKIKYVQSQIN